jgi:exodeoxyribonuclease VII small subunit
MPKSPAPPAPASSIAEFEHSLDELEQLVTRMEGGELSLDESLKSFERGIGLYRHCQTALEQAELRVRLLLDPEAPDTAEPFESRID